MRNIFSITIIAGVAFVAIERDWARASVADGARPSDRNHIRVFGDLGYGGPISCEIRTSAGVTDAQKPVTSRVRICR